MRNLIVYLGSDHVVQRPGFDFQKNTLSMTCNFRDAAAQACKRNAAGILNTYRIDLDLLSDKDIVFFNDQVTLCSMDAINALVFIGASFVHQ